MGEGEGQQGESWQTHFVSSRTTQNRYGSEG